MFIASTTSILVYILALGARMLHFSISVYTEIPLQTKLTGLNTNMTYSLQLGVSASRRLGVSVARCVGVIDHFPFLHVAPFWYSSCIYLTDTKTLVSGSGFFAGDTVLNEDQDISQRFCVQSGSSRYPQRRLPRLNRNTYLL
jgi:hypothetical protein